MKTINKFLFGVVALVALTGCKDKMVELNTNPAIVSGTSPEYLFYYATNAIDAPGRGSDADRMGGLMRTTGYWSAGYVGAAYGNTPNNWVDPDATSAGNPTTDMRWYEYTQRAGKRLQSMMTFIDQKTGDDAERYAEQRSIANLFQVYLAWRLFDTYGALPYTEGLKASTTGLLTPQYDLIQDIYSQLDQTVKDEVAFLKTTPSSNNTSLGQYDPVYGWKFTINEAGGSAAAALGDGALQRKLWAKFGNALRIKMAMRLQKRDPAHFAAVIADATSDAAYLMSNVNEGAELKYGVVPGNGTSGKGNDTDDANQLSMFWASSASFVNSLQLLDDPRLPLVTRANEFDPAFNYAYKVLSEDFPDSIRKYNGMLDNTKKSRFIGITTNPNLWYNTGNAPGTVPIDPTIVFTLYNPSTSGAVFNGPITGNPLYNFSMNKADNTSFDKTGKAPTTVTAANVAYRLSIVSGTQCRYWVKIGWGSASWRGQDYWPTETSRDNIRLTRKFISYADQCLMLAHAANELGAAVGGKTAQQWLNEGVTASMVETHNDAKRCYVIIATNNTMPPVPGYTTAQNPLYGITPAMITTYLAQPWLQLTGTKEQNKEKIAVQAWIAMYQNVEEAWGWQKVTGYPQVIDWASKNTTVSPGNPTINVQVITGGRPTGATVPTVYPDDGRNVYPTFPCIEQPYGATTGAKLIPQRRLNLPADGSQINKANRDAAVNKMMQDPAYKEENNSTGRIWWDMP